MKKFIVSLAMALTLALPVASQATTLPPVPQGGDPLFRLPRVYNNWDYFNSPAPIYGGATLWVSTNQWSVGTLHIFNATEEYTLQTSEKAFVKYFNLNFLPDGEWHAQLCTNSYMGEVCGQNMTFVK